MNGLAELITIKRYWRRWSGPSAGRGGGAQQRSQPGELGDAGDIRPKFVESQSWSPSRCLTELQEFLPHRGV